MLARAYFNQYALASRALAHPRVTGMAARLPYRSLHRLLVSLTWLETWLRWPLKTLKMSDGLAETFSRIDPDGTRFGLTEEVRASFRKNRLYLELADLSVLLSGIDNRGFRKRALRVENREVLDRELSAGSGAIVMGFRIGTYPLIPLALGSLGYDLSMIVGGDPLIEMGQGLGGRFAPVSASRVRFLSAQDPLVLAKCRDALSEGRVVSTLMELSPRKYAKTTPVKFLGWDVQVPYGVPYLAAMTGKSIVPAVFTREPGPRFRLRFIDPLPAPNRDRESILRGAQDLYSSLERQVLLYPDQWVGWTLLNSHLGIDLGDWPSVAVPTLS